MDTPQTDRHENDETKLTQLQHSLYQMSHFSVFHIVSSLNYYSFFFFLLLRPNLITFQNDETLNNFDNFKNNIVWIYHSHFSSFERDSIISQIKVYNFSNKNVQILKVIAPK